jgi:dihydroxy-acid dehydratase
MPVQWCKALRLTRCMSNNASSSEIKLNKYSSILTEHKSRGAAQAMLYATGIKEEDITKPQVGIASMWWEGNPCNMHLLDLAMEIKKSVEKQDLVGLRFNTVGVSDVIAQ